MDLPMTTKVQTAQTSEVTSRYLSVRRMTEELCAGLSPEDCMLQSMADASPVKWHLAHTTWFFETFILTPHLRRYKPANPAFRDLFNSYYNAVGHQPQRDRRGLFSRPSFEQVREYREHVDSSMLKLLEDASPDVADMAVLGTHHEQQHQELIVTDFKNALWSSPLKPAWRRPLKSCSTEVKLPKFDWISFSGREVEIGHGGNGFAFDNELPRHRILIQDFKLAYELTTNGEYLEFIDDGGYEKPDLWLSDGWKTATENGWDAPLYWQKRDGEWWHYTANGLRPISDDLSAPVTHVSFYEADAFARWSDARLPSEFEWEVVAESFGMGSLQNGNFLDCGSLHPQPAQEDQFFGDCWQWTSSAYLGYPGYKPAEGALGEYNGKFMINQMVLRGASCATPKSHARPTYRNFFSPAARWQFSGIRLAR
jgi:ergothioneine biosynthesis protein EgtB